MSEPHVVYRKLYNLEPWIEGKTKEQANKCL